MNLDIDPITGNYKCFRCGKISRTKQAYDRHNARKRPCGLVIGESSSPFVCQYCNRGFVRKFNLDRHIQSCIFNTPEGYQIIVQNAVMNTMQDENKHLHEKMVLLEQISQMRSDSDKKITDLQTHLLQQADQHRKEIEELKELMRNPPQVVTGDIVQGDKIEDNRQIVINFNDFDKPTLPSFEQMFQILNEYKGGAFMPMFKHIFINLTQYPENTVLYMQDASRGKMLIRSEGRWQAGEPTDIMKRTRNYVYKIIRKEISDNRKTFLDAWDGEKFMGWIMAAMTNHEYNDESIEVKEMLHQIEVVRFIIREFLVENNIIDKKGNLISLT